MEEDGATITSLDVVDVAVIDSFVSEVGEKAVTGAAGAGSDWVAIDVKDTSSLDATEDCVAMTEALDDEEAIKLLCRYERLVPS